MKCLCLLHHFRSDIPISPPPRSQWLCKHFLIMCLLIGKLKSVLSFQNYVPTVFENYTASFEIDKHRIELNMWDTSGKSFTSLSAPSPADTASIHSQPDHDACPWLRPWEDSLQLPSPPSPAVIPLTDCFDLANFIWMSFVFSCFFLAQGICYLCLLSLLETSVPAMPLGALCLHSWLCCPLCVAVSSHALARGQATVGGERSVGVDN